MTRTIGIDLGTSNSAAALMKDGKMRLVPSSEGSTSYGKMFPSIVAFKEDGEIIVGKTAKNYAYTHPERTVRWIKRKIGTDYTVKIDGYAYTPQDISALIIKKVKLDAETYLGEKIDKAVISAPAYFNNNQRNATKEAGELAGLEVLRIVSEPTAASLAYGLDKTKEKLNIAVLDLGAGTFDVTILKMNHSVFQVVSTSGDIRLGGKNMDDAILDYIVNDIEEKHNVNLENDCKNLNILRDAGEMAKIRLSSEFLTTVNTELDIDGCKLNSNITLTREKLEALIKPQLDRLQGPVEQALSDSKLSIQDIDKLILVGGPTRIPIVRKYFASFFEVEPELGIDPMGIVATGASIQASVLNGEIRSMLLLDVTPLSLGVETSGGLFTRLIKRNTTIPAQETRIFATEEVGQTSMMIHVLQGERAMAKDNISVGLFKLDGIPSAPKYEQKVEVDFKIDANGILNVSAEILETGKKTAIQIAETKSLSEDTITRIILDATKFDEADEKGIEAVETRAHTKSVVYAMQTLLDEAGGKISAREKKSVEQTFERLKSAQEGYKIQEIKTCTEELFELVKGVKMKVKKMAQAEALLSSVERKLGDGLSSEKKMMLIKAFEKLEDTPYALINTEILKLREMVFLLDLDGEAE